MGTPGPSPWPTARYQVPMQEQGWAWSMLGSTRVTSVTEGARDPRGYHCCHLSSRGKTEPSSGGPSPEAACTPWSVPPSCESPPVLCAVPSAASEEGQTDESGSVPTAPSLERRPQ